MWILSNNLMDNNNQITLWLEISHQILTKIYSKLSDNKRHNQQSMTRNTASLQQSKIRSVDARRMTTQQRGCMKENMVNITTPTKTRIAKIWMMVPTRVLPKIKVQNNKCKKVIAQIITFIASSSIIASITKLIYSNKINKMSKIIETKVNRCLASLVTQSQQWWLHNWQFRMYLWLENRGIMIAWVKQRWTKLIKHRRTTTHFVAMTIRIRVSQILDPILVQCL